MRTSSRSAWWWVGGWWAAADDADMMVLEEISRDMDMFDGQYLSTDVRSVWLTSPRRMKTPLW